MSEDVNYFYIKMFVCAVLVAVNVDSRTFNGKSVCVVPSSGLELSTSDWLTIDERIM